MKRASRMLVSSSIIMLLAFAGWAGKVHAGGNATVDDSPAVSAVPDVRLEPIKPAPAAQRRPSLACGSPGDMSDVVAIGLVRAD